VLCAAVDIPPPRSINPSLEGASMHISDINSNTLRRTAIVFICPLSVVCFLIIGVVECIWRGGVAAYDTGKDYAGEIREIVEGARANWAPK
jgi:hypothetical protein